MDYHDFRSGTALRPVIADVPGAWTEYEVGDKGFPGQGYGTYRLQVKTGIPAGKLMSFRINTFSSAYTIYVNDTEIASNGKVAASPQLYVPEYRPLTTVFKIPGSEFDLIIQVANYHFYKGGFWYSINMGTGEGIGNLQDILLGKELFLIGALTIISIYYFSIYFLIRNTKMYLYFAVICLLAIIPSDLLGELLFCRLFPGIPFTLVVLLWYTSTQWLPFFLILYVGEMFPAGFTRRVNRIFGTMTVIMTLLYIFTPVSFYTRLGRAGDYLMLVGILYTVVLAVKGFREKIQGAILYTVATLLLLLTVAHDVLFLANIIKSELGEITFIGVFVLLFVHTLIHARRFKSEYDEKARLLIDIENSKEMAIKAEIKFLQAQIKPHFLYNTLSVIASLSTRNPMESRRIIVNLAEYLRSSFDFDNNDDMVPLFRELELVKAYVEIEKARFRNRIKFELNCVNVPDIMVPRLSIQPLVENAIRHGTLKKAEGGTVTLSIKKDHGMVQIDVADNGKGMSHTLVTKLLQDADGTQGVGIKNINRRLLRHYGKGLDIKSGMDEGTRVSFGIPAVNVVQEGRA